MQEVKSGPLYGCETLAFPTIGIVLLGGVADSSKRFPLHNSAGIAYTSVEHDIYTRTRLFYSEEPFVLVNGNLVDPDDPRTPIHILSHYATGNLKRGKHLSVYSQNSGIISGSSDAGAAALAKATQEIFHISDMRSLENDFRSISESIGRSLHGGLTVTEIIEGIPVTTRLLRPDDFSDYVIVAFMFSSVRNPSDAIHKSIVKSPDYSQRIGSTSKKCAMLRKLATRRDIKGIFELAMNDTDEYHSLLESVGVKVISSEMSALIKRLKEESGEFWRAYIVTGGTNVFVATEKQNASKLKEMANSLNIPSRKLVVAGAARVFIDF